MCGIAGAFRFDEPPDPAPVLQMVRALAHRGPDDEHVVSLPDGAMGTRRLSIVDLAGGRQPLRDTARRITLAMNGEIFNHSPLRDELTARDARFATASDTEVAAWLFGDRDPALALDRLDGQFAIAAYDHRRRRLALARDRLGQKPLYWSQLADGTLLFGSELKALLRHPGLRREVDPVAVEQLLLFEFIPAPRTIYRGVHKLEPGTLLLADAGGVQLSRWWWPPLTGEGRVRDSRERYAEAVSVALMVAVKQRMMADVPVAYLLSGGVDSSAVVGMAARRSREPLRTFSLITDEPSFDESGPARLMAAHVGSDHTEIHLSPGDLPGLLDALEAGLCEPLADGGMPSMLHLSRGVSAAGFKAALTGDGADEHFGGYPTYAAHRLALAVAPGRRLLQQVAARLPASTDNLSPGFKARRFAAGLDYPMPRRNQLWLGAFLPDELPALLGRPVSAGAWAEVDRWGEVSAPIRDPARRAMFLDQRLYLGEGVLAKADRAAMLASLELRSPFMDHRLVGLSAVLPGGSYISGGRTKVLLRRAAAELLPPALRDRPKKGFGTPIGPWLKGPLSHLLDDLPERLEGVAEIGEVRRYIAEHRRGHRDHRRRLWSLMILGRWWRGPWGP